MKAALTLAILILASAQALADDRVATPGALDGLVRTFTNCDLCSQMENLRVTKFQPAHRNTRLEGTATAALSEVMKHADYISDRAENDRVKFRNAHYANEIKSFIYLAADSFQFETEAELAGRVAYINNSLGSRDLFNQVLSDEYFNRPENKCRRDVFAQAVKYEECNFENGVEREAARTQRRKPAIKACGTLTDSVKSCETRQATRRLVK